MEKTRTFKKELVMAGKSFEEKVVMDLVTGLADITIMENDEVPFVYCLTRPQIEVLSIPIVLAELEDEVHIYANKQNGDLLVDTLLENGFIEEIEMTTQELFDIVVGNEPYKSDD